MIGVRLPDIDARRTRHDDGPGHCRRRRQPALALRPIAWIRFRMKGRKMDKTDSATSVMQIGLPTNIFGLPPEIVIACRNDCSMMPPSTRDRIMGASGISTLRKT